MSRVCGELLYGKRYPLKLKGVVCKNYVGPKIMYGSKAWCPEEGLIINFQRTDR